MIYIDRAASVIVYLLRSNAKDITTYIGRVRVWWIGNSDFVDQNLNIFVADGRGRGIISFLENFEAMDFKRI